VKKELLALIKKKEERKQALIKKSDASDSLEEVRSIGETIDQLNEELAELRSLADKAEEDDEEPEAEPTPGDPHARGNEQHVHASPIGRTAVLGTYGLAAGQTSTEERSEDPHATPEYRQAFMEYVARGKTSDVLEMRADAITTTGDIGAVIPTTIMNRIVEKLQDNGRIWARITNTAFQGGVQIPVSTLKPVATWVGEGDMSDKQKKTLVKISFTYHKLQSRVAVTLVADVVSLPIFEQTVADNIVEAMIIAIEEAVINGTGDGQPLGITQDEDIASTQIVNVSADDIKKYSTWTDLYGKIPRSYRNGSVLIMNDSDWNKYLLGMVDTTGQPVARVTFGIDGTTNERFIGKEVIAVEDHLESIDDAAVGDVVGILCRLQDYMFNSNMQMAFKRYFDDNTDEWISKATLIGDGRLADRFGVVLLKKAAASTTTIQAAQTPKGKNKTNQEEPPANEEQPPKDEQPPVGNGASK